MFKLPSKAKKQRVHFLHIRKTGGSAIKSVLKDFLETPGYSIKLHGHRASLEKIPKGDSVVFFLRDPVSRFISGFYSRKRKGLPRNNSEWRPEEKEIFEHFATPGELAAALANAQSYDHALAIMAMENVQHFKPYSQWYVDFDYFRSRLDDVLFIGFQESLAADFNQLKKNLGIPAHINLPTDDISAHRNPENINKVIDEKGIPALHEWYAEDYRFISLCREIISGRVSTGRQNKAPFLRRLGFFWQ